MVGEKSQDQNMSWCLVLIIDYTCKILSVLFPYDWPGSVERTGVGGVPGLGQEQERVGTGGGGDWGQG